jgi:hypothetical protein
MTAMRYGCPCRPIEPRLGCSIGIEWRANPPVAREFSSKTTIF